LKIEDKIRHYTIKLQKSCTIENKKSAANFAAPFKQTTKPFNLNASTYCSGAQTYSNIIILDYEINDSTNQHKDNLHTALYLLTNIKER